MFKSDELMFTVYEHMFKARKHKFTGLEHKKERKVEENNQYKEKSDLATRGSGSHKVWV